MYSAAASLDHAPFADSLQEARPGHTWQHFPVSEPGHHRQACCEIAREWIVAMDFAQLNGAPVTSGPRWLREKYEWGPSAWPIHWCEIVDRKVIDCGAHSALAHEAFKARGLTAYRAQFVLRYSADALEQWRRSWTDASVSDHWIAADVIYHEGNAVLVGDALKLWDSSAGWWIEAAQNGGYGSLEALRIAPGTDGPTSEPHVLQWGEHSIPCGEWYELGRL